MTDQPVSDDKSQAPGVDASGDGMQAPHPHGSGRPLWPQFRQLVIFQFKLYLDALRDLVMSPLSIVAFVADVVIGNHGRLSWFEQVLQAGRRTERAINLFNQHAEDDAGQPGIDSLIDQLEERLRNQYRDGCVTSSARESIENTLEKLRGGLRGRSQL